MKKLLLFSATLFCAVSAAIAQCGGGTGVDGAYSATSSTTLTGGTYNYTTFNIDPGVTVTVTGSQPLIIYCTGAATINGSLLAVGQNGADGVTYVNGGVGGLGVAGGANGGTGTFASGSGPITAGPGSGPGGVSTEGAGWSGGGGAGYTTTGASSGGVGGIGGPSYGTIQISGTDAGSGGGGGSGGYDCGAGGGGGGGGFVKIQSATSIMIGAAGVISVNGGNGGSDGTGNCGGGGGGSAGSIWLASSSVTFNGIMTAVGGNGGASAIPGNPYYGVGGNGSVGRIRIDGSTTGTGTANPTVGYTGTFIVLTSAMATTNENCFGDSTGTAVVTYMNGTGPVTYTWTPAGPNASSQTGLGAGNYSCLITDQNGCTSTATGTITQPTQLTAVTTTLNATCYGQCNGAAAISMSGGTPGYTYLWAPGGQTTPSISNLCAGCYTVMVTDANGCTYAELICVTQPPAPTPNVLGNDTMICASDAFTLCAPGGFAAYMWNTGSTAMCVTADSNFCYSVQMSDAMGCITMDTLCVTETPCLGIDEVTADAKMMLSR